MARSDQIKEELARWRLCFGLLVAIGASLVGWVVPELSQTATYTSTTGIPKIGEINLILAALVAIPIVAVLAVLVYLAMMRKTDELGDLA